MKQIIFLLACVFVLPSCALMSKYIRPAASSAGSAGSADKKSTATHKNTATKNKAHKTLKNQTPKNQNDKAHTSPPKQNIWITKAQKQLKTSTLTKKQIQNLQKLSKNDKTPILKDKAHMLLGRHFFKKSQYKKALSHYTKVQQEPHKHKAFLQKARLYKRLNQTEKSLQMIENLTTTKDLPKPLLKSAYLLKLALISKAQPPTPDVELFKIYCHVLALEDNQKEEYKISATQVLFRMKEKDVLDIKSEDFIEPLKDLVFFRVGKIYLAREEFRRSLRFFKKFVKFSKDSELEKQALKYIQAIQSRKKVKKRHIGAILPLSGPSASIGKRSLKGLQMGLGFYNLEDKSAFKLIVIDSQGQADKVKKAVKDLVTKHHVIAIVGGVLSRTAPVLAKEAQNFAVPALLMSQKAGLTQMAGYIFQNGLPAHLMATQLADFLMDRIEATRFAILYPNDPYGVGQANAFWSAVEKRGGKITGVQFYKPGETDFNGPLKRLTGTYYLTDRTKEYEENLKQWYLKKAKDKQLNTGRKAPLNVLPPVVDFDVLFVPDSLKTLSLIVPHLAYNDIKNISLAGATLWNKSVNKHLKYVDRLVFLDLGLSTPAFKESIFYKQFYRVFGSAPGLLEGQAYDSALALRQVVATGADDRNELRNNLTQLKTFHGHLGEIKINKQREFVRPLKVISLVTEEK